MSANSEGFGETAHSYPAGAFDKVNEFNSLHIILFSMYMYMYDKGQQIEISLVI